MRTLWKRHGKRSEPKPERDRRKRLSRLALGSAVTIAVLGAAGSSVALGAVLPDGGEPVTQLEPAGETAAGDQYVSESVAVCEQRGSGGFVEITISRKALPAHVAHGDVFPVPKGGCSAAGAPVSEGGSGSGSGSKSGGQGSSVLPLALLAAGVVVALAFALSIASLLPGGRHEHRP